MRVVLVLITVLSLAFAKEFLTAYKYDVKKISIHKDSVSKEIKSFYILIKPNGKPLNIAAVDIKNRVYKQRYFLCKSKGSIINCEVDCDGGFFKLDKDFNLLYLGTYVEDLREMAIGLSTIDSNITLEVAKMSYPPKNIENYRYVCYLDKSNGIYKGCYLEIESCDNVGTKQFGRYLNSKDAYSAYNRCINSTPKKSRK